MTDVRTHYWQSSDGIQLAWREVGEGRPVILMHGLFSDAQMNWIKFGHADRIADGAYDGALITTRRANGQVAFQLLMGESLGTDRVQQMRLAQPHG